MTKKEFLEKYGDKRILAPTQEIANQLLKEAHDAGFTWPEGTSLLEESNWSGFGKETYYFFNVDDVTVWYGGYHPNHLEYFDYAAAQTSNKIEPTETDPHNLPAHLEDLFHMSKIRDNARREILKIKSEEELTLSKLADLENFLSTDVYEDAISDIKDHFHSERSYVKIDLLEAEQDIFDYLLEAEQDIFDYLDKMQESHLKVILKDF